MTPLADLAPEELDVAACKAVGIEAEWMYESPHDLPGEEPLLYVDKAGAVECAGLDGLPESAVKPWYPAVSKSPADCAQLKRACLEKGLGWPVAFWRDMGFEAYLQSPGTNTLLSANLRGSDRDEIAILVDQIDSAVADTEERAVALAVAATKEETDG